MVIDFGVILRVFALLMDFREVMLTSPPELAHCGGGSCGASMRIGFLYTFDVADDPTRGELGGRRFFKKKINPYIALLLELTSIIHLLL